MQMRRLAAVLAVGLACGGDDLDSGLAPGKPGSELESTEQTQLCQAASSYLEDHISQRDWAGYMCTLEVFGDAAQMGGGDTAKAIAACQTLRDACIAADTEDPLEFGCMETQDWSTCAATVDEIETCYEDAVAKFDSLIADFTCKILDPAEAQRLQEKYGTDYSDPFPPSCDVVQQKCAVAFGGEEDDEESGEGTDPPTSLPASWPGGRRSPAGR